MRDSLLRTAVLAGAAAVAITELLSPFHLLERWPVALACALVAAVWIKWGPRPRPWSDSRALSEPRPSGIDPYVALYYTLTALAAIPVALAAALSPPNSADAMAYHLPRVLYWAQAGSVAFFPTPYFNQVMLQPLAEYLMLHTYLLTGGDHLVNLISFAAYLGSILGVSAIAAALGLPPRAQAAAALICATLPNAILQASGAKNDFLLAFWLVCAIYFTARRNVAFFALSVALAVATKATAYLFLPPVLLYAAFIPPRRKVLWIAAAVLVIVLAINGPQYARNVQLSGSPLGYDSAQGDGYFRWRNEHPGLRALASNALRHTSEQLGARSPRWNQSVYDAVVRVHRALGLDPEDPDTTWRGSHFSPPVNANHEANANNRWHLLLFAIAALFAIATRNRTWTLYAAGLVSAFMFFCLYLKWQPFLARLELPLFVVAAPLGAFFLSKFRYPALATIVCVFLVNNARPALFENWTRPLKGPHSLFVTARDLNYFSDMSQWNNRASYLESVDRTARTGCMLVGIDITENQLEYPFQALLRERTPHVRFLHTLPAVAAQPKPCAVFCPDCIANQQKIALYRDIGAPIEIGRFLLFLPQSEPVE